MRTAQPSGTPSLLRWAVGLVRCTSAGIAGFAKDPEDRFSRDVRRLHLLDTLVLLNDHVEQYPITNVNHTEISGWR